MLAGTKMRMRLAGLLVIALLIPACRESDDDAAPVSSPPPEVLPPTFGASGSVGTVQSPSIVEASGLAASRTNPGVLWTHNDSSSPPDNRLFALTPAGTHLGIYTITGASAADWEDMAIGPGPGGADFLYAGDIGDNAPFDRASITIYRIPEPAVDPSQPPVAVNLAGTALTCVYPDGPRDAETLMCDPRTGDLLILSKNGAGASNLYRWPAPQDPSGTFTLIFERTLTFGAGALPGSPLVTGGDISPDGTLVAVRTYDRIFVWTRQYGQTVSDAMAAAPAFTMTDNHADLDEAVAFAADGSGMYTLNEGASQTIYFIPRTD